MIMMIKKMIAVAILMMILPIAWVIKNYRFIIAMIVMILVLGFIGHYDYLVAIGQY